MNIDGIKIRSATLNDLPVLLEYEQGIIHAERPYDKKIKEEKVHYYDLKELITQKNSEVLVAHIQEQIVASGYAKIRKSKPYATHDRHTYLGFMYIDEKYRGNRINKLILEKLIDWSSQQGIDNISLDVYAENTSAIKAYESLGFEKSIIEMRMDIQSS